MPSPPSSMVVMSVVVEELQKQLFAWESELDSLEGIIVMWEDGIVASKRPWEGVHGT
jgi:hypothetical protein